MEYTYYFDAKDFQNAVVNGAVDKYIEPIVQVSKESLADDMAKGVMNAINKANLTYLIPYGHEITAFANINGYGLASLASTAYQLCWDFNQYGNNPKKLAVSVLITTGSMAVTLAAGSLIAASGVGPVAAVGISIVFGAVISSAEDKIRQERLG